MNRTTTVLAATTLLRPLQQGKSPRPCAPTCTSDVAVSMASPEESQATPASPQERQAAPASPSPVAEAPEVLAETLVVPAEGPTLDTGAEEGPSSSQTDRPNHSQSLGQSQGKGQGSFQS